MLLCRHRRFIRFFLITLVVFGVIGSLSAFAQDYADDPFEYDFEIGVVGRKTFDPVNKFHVTLYGGINPFNKLITDFMGGLGVQFHFLSWLGIEARGYYHFGGMTAAAASAEKQAKAATRRDFYIDFVTYEFLGHVVLSPIYGKHHLWGATFVNYLMYFFVGGGLIGLDQVVIVPNPNTSAFGISFGLGIRFYVSPLFHVGLELRDLLYQDRSFNDAHLTSNFIIHLALGINLPIFEMPQRKL